MTEQLSGVTTDPYEAGWRAWLQLPVNRLAGAAMKLSHAGRQAVTVEQIAAEAQVPLPEATTLTSKFYPVDADGVIGGFLAEHHDPTAQQHIHIDARTISGGCAPDVVFLAVLGGRPVEAEATCPATGAPIQVRLAAGGVAQVQPADTVIAAVHPVDLPAYDDLDNLQDVQVSLCDLMPFFSSARAAEGWLVQHPNGRLFSVAEFREFSQRIWLPETAPESAHRTADHLP